MKENLGDIIYQNRLAGNLTQDQYGAKYDVSGPAIFKFEKGHVSPSLDLWLKFAADAGMTERRAVLLWVKSKLPEAYQTYVELQSPTAAENEARKVNKKGQKADYGKIETPEQVRELVAKDKTLPKGLRDLLIDDDLWELFKPTGSEINLLRDTFTPLGRGTKATYREALRLLREFAQAF